MNQARTEHAMENIDPQNELFRLLSSDVVAGSTEPFEPMRESAPLPPPTRLVRRPHPKKIPPSKQCIPRKVATTGLEAADSYDSMFEHLADFNCARCGRVGHDWVDCFVMNGNNL